MILTDEDAALIRERTHEIGGLLHGLDPQFQGAILADLLATWLAGHFGSSSLREELLQIHVKTVRALIPCNERELLDRHRSKFQ